MGVTSNVIIMNSALRKLGAAPITSEDDDNTRARLVKAAYPLKRDELLRSHPWRFNKAYASLALVSPQPTNVFDYDFVFALPTDCARIFEVDLGPDEAWEEIGGNRFACDNSEVDIKYGQKITDTTKFDDNFVEVLSWAIAADIAYALTQSTAMADAALKNYETSLRNSRSYSAQTASVQTPVYGDDWVGVRR